MREVLTGLSLGLGAGIAPGPLLALTLQRTLERGFGAGARVAIAPLLTDVPIIALALVAVGALPGSVETGLALAGGSLVIVLGLNTVLESRTARLRSGSGGSARDIHAGVIVNVLNPHPWVFWFVIGGPLVVSAWRGSPAGAIGFLIAFNAVLVGSKLALAFLAGSVRHRIDAPTYRSFLAGSGLLLVAVGAALIARSA